MNNLGNIQQNTRSFQSYNAVNSEKLFSSLPLDANFEQFSHFDIGLLALFKIPGFGQNTEKLRAFGLTESQIRRGRTKLAKAGWWHTKGRGPNRGCSTLVTAKPVSKEEGRRLIEKGINWQPTEDPGNESTSSLHTAQLLRDLTGSVTRGLAVWGVLQLLARLPKHEVTLDDLKQLMGLGKDATIRMCNILIQADRMRRNKKGKYKILLEKPDKSVRAQQLKMRKLSTGESSAKRAVNNSPTRNPLPQKGEEKNLLSEDVLSGTTSPPKLHRYKYQYNRKQIDDYLLDVDNSQIAREFVALMDGIQIDELDWGNQLAIFYRKFSRQTYSYRELCLINQYLSSKRKASLHPGDLLDTDFWRKLVEEFTQTAGLQQVDNHLEKDYGLETSAERVQIRLNMARMNGLTIDDKDYITPGRMDNIRNGKMLFVTAMAAYGFGSYKLEKFLKDTERDRMVNEIVTDATIWAIACATQEYVEKLLDIDWLELQLRRGEEIARLEQMTIDTKLMSQFEMPC